jgi:transposase
MTWKSLITSPPSAIAQTRSASTSPGHAPATGARPAPATAR